MAFFYYTTAFFYYTFFYYSNGLFDCWDDFLRFYLLIYGKGFDYLIYYFTSFYSFCYFILSLCFYVFYSTFYAIERTLNDFAPEILRLNNTLRFFNFREKLSILFGMHIYSSISSNFIIIKSSYGSFLTG